MYTSIRYLHHTLICGLACANLCLPLQLGGALDAVIAAKRVEMSKQGVQTCGDVDEECTVEW